MHRRLVATLLCLATLIAASTLTPTAAGALTRAAAPGWQSETLWSSTSDDWEPTVAVDPSSSWVYEATTRYGGAKACTSCPDPAIIVRGSSDCGVTWSADRFLCSCKNTKAQNDPVLAVATAGVVYAVWMND